MAGARAVEGTVFEEQQAGVGGLDILKSFAALDALRSGGSNTSEPSPSESRLSLSRSFAYPDPERPLEAWLVLRAQDGSLADPPPDTILLHVDGAERWTTRRQAPGLYQLVVWSQPHSGGSELTLQVHSAGQELFSRRVPVAVDRAASQGGFAARGGCQYTAYGAAGPAALFVLGLLLAAGAYRRKQRSTVNNLS
jgi:MYXO-CTERM domain-containing protein